MTPTSATGADPRRAGFTLTEVMVALVIVGLAATAVVMAIPDGRLTLAQEGERFAARLRRAQEEAVLTNRPVEVAFDRAGYRFRARQGAAWAPLQDGPFKPIAWEPATQLSVSGDTARVAFDPTGLATPIAVTLTRQSATAVITVDPAGNVRVDAP